LSSYGLSCSAIAFFFHYRLRTVSKWLPHPELRMELMYQKERHEVRVLPKSKIFH
jgi:hypothetical protein